VEPIRQLRKTLKPARWTKTVNLNPTPWQISLCNPKPKPGAKRATPPTPQRSYSRWMDVRRGNWGRLSTSISPKTNPPTLTHKTFCTLNGVPWTLNTVRIHPKPEYGEILGEIGHNPLFLEIVRSGLHVGRLCPGSLVSDRCIS
jgi:hypothetical protein